MGNPTVRLFGTLENVVTTAAGAGATVAGAKVRVELSNYGPYIPSEVGTTRGMLAKGTEYAANPTPGHFEAFLFRNDQIYPIGNALISVIVEDADGNVIQCGAYRFNADGDFDLATQTPIDGQDPPPPLPPTCCTGTPRHPVQPQHHHRRHQLHRVRSDPDRQRDAGDGEPTAGESLHHHLQAGRSGESHRGMAGECLQWNECVFSCGVAFDADLRGR